MYRLPLFTTFFKICIFFALNFAFSHTAAIKDPLTHGIRQSNESIDPSSINYRDSFTQFINLMNKNELSEEQKVNMVNAAVYVLQQINPNYRLQQRLFGVDIVRELLDFRSKLSLYNSPYEFHLKMCRLFMKLNDIHTVYLPPEPLLSAQAFLPFQIQYYSDLKKKRRFIVTEVYLKARFFRQGVEVISFDGVPIENAVRDIGERMFCRRDNEDCIRMGQAQITSRIFVLSGAVRKSSSTVQFKSSDGEIRSRNFKWILYYNSKTGADQSLEKSGMNTEMAPFSFENSVEGRAEWTRMEAPIKIPRRKSRKYINRATDDTIRFSSSGVQRQKFELAPEVEDILEAERVVLRDGSDYGILTVKTFSPKNETMAYKELRRILPLFPTSGLVVDVRDNPGGLVRVVFNLWYHLFKGHVQEYRPTMRASKSLVSLYNSSTTDPVFDVLQSNFLAGADMTGPLTSFTERGRMHNTAYFGPVVVLCNSLSMSGGDLLTSTVKDYLGPRKTKVIGTDDATNGAGATTISLSTFFKGVTDGTSGFGSLPKGADFSTAFERLYRSGNFSGQVIEQFGVPVDEKYFETKNDILNDDADMLVYLGNVIKDM